MEYFEVRMPATNSSEYIVCLKQQYQAELYHFACDDCMLCYRPFGGEVIDFFNYVTTKHNAKVKYKKTFPHFSIVFNTFLAAESFKKEVNNMYTSKNMTPWEKSYE